MAHISKASAPAYTSCARIIGIRIEQLLAFDLVIGDRLLTVRRNEPVDKLLAEVLFHVRMLGRIHQYYTVLIEQTLVTFHQDLQVTLVLEMNPRPTVR